MKPAPRHGIYHRGHMPRVALEPKQKEVSNQSDSWTYTTPYKKTLWAETRRAAELSHDPIAISARCLVIHGRDSMSFGRVICINGHMKTFQDPDP